MFYQNVSISIILKHECNRNIRSNMSMSQAISNELSNSIADDFTKLLNKEENYELIIGDSIIYGYKPADYIELEKLKHYSESESHTKLKTKTLLIDESNITSSSDNKSNNYTLYFLPVFIKTKREFINNISDNSLLTISNETQKIIENYFSLLNIKSLVLGYGYNELLQDTLLNDFECLFNLEGLITNREIKIFVPYHFSFYEEDGTTMALFKSLISFEESYDDVKKPGSLIDEYINFTKNFRTGLSILKLLGRPYKILKYPTMTDTLIDTNILENPLLKEYAISLPSEYIVEKISGSTKDLLEVDHVEINAYEDLQNGIIGVLITWSKNGACILRESVYPTNFETGDVLKDIKGQVKKSVTKKVNVKVNTLDINEFQEGNDIKKL